MITYAQEITVTGKVTAGGEEMPGVTVAVKGQTRGTITSTDGSYQIQVNGNESLIFSLCRLRNSNYTDKQTQSY